MLLSKPYVILYCLQLSFELSPFLFPHGGYITMLGTHLEGTPSPYIIRLIDWHSSNELPRLQAAVEPVARSGRGSLGCFDQPSFLPRRGGRGLYVGMPRSTVARQQAGSTDLKRPGSPQLGKAAEKAGLSWPARSHLRSPSHLQPGRYLDRSNTDRERRWTWRGRWYKMRICDVKTCVLFRRRQEHAH